MDKVGDRRSVTAKAYGNLNGYHVQKIMTVPEHACSMLCLLLFGILSLKPKLDTKMQAAPIAASSNAALFISIITRSFSVPETLPIFFVPSYIPFVSCNSRLISYTFSGPLPGSSPTRLTSRRASQSTKLPPTPGPRQPLPFKSAILHQRGRLDRLFGPQPGAVVGTESPTESLPLFRDGYTVVDAGSYEGHTFQARNGCWPG
jgi:hypothetical protein